VGSYHLYSIDGGSFTVSTKENALSNDIMTAGLRAGTYGAGSAQTVTKMREVYSAAGVAPFAATYASANVGVLNGDTLVINGIAIGAAVATDDQFSFDATTGSSRAASAIAIAAAINKQTERTGVTAVAQANVLRGTGFVAESGQAAIFLNGQSISVNTMDMENIIDTINEYQGLTGVVASRFGDGLELRAADGRNISIGTDAASAGFLGLAGLSVGGNIGDAATSADALVWYSTVSLESDVAFTVESGYEGIANFEALGFRRGTFGGALGDKVSQIDVSTQNGANDAIRAIDAAINQVSKAQAQSGAINNRLDVIVNNLSEGLQNMSASRSRILDTDYATETTELAKQQIIQQAATAMLAQANQQPQGVLALLR
jgi:flagellin